MANVTGREFVGATGGGSTAGGQYIWLTLKLGDSDETIIVEKSRVTALIAAIGTTAGMARADRIKTTPMKKRRRLRKVHSLSSYLTQVLGSASTGARSWT